MIAPELVRHRKIYRPFNQKEFKKNSFVFLVLLIPTLCFLLFWAYVHLDSFLLAFQLPVVGEMDSYYFDPEFSNFKKAFTELFTGGNLFIAFKNTIIYYLAGTLITFPLSILFSYFIYKKIRCYKFFRVVTYLPVIITSAALVALFKATINLGGPLDAIYNSLGLKWTYPMGETDKAMFVMVFYSVSFGFGGNIVLLCGAMNSIDKSILEAGEIDGASWVRELFSIIIPTIWPTISTILILGLASILGASGPILAFSQDITAPISSVTTLNFELYRLVQGQLGVSRDINYASCLGFIMTLFTLPIVIFTKTVLMREKK